LEQVGIFWLYFLISVLLASGFAIAIHISKNPKNKLLIFRFSVITAHLAFGTLLFVFGVSGSVLLLFLSLIVISVFLGIRSTTVCLECNSMIRGENLFMKPSTCEKCGVPINT